MVRFVFNGATVELDDKELTARLLEKQIEADAEERALMVVYRVGGEPDPNRPWNGLLTERLDISTDAAYGLIKSGKLGSCCAGKKNYRVSERHVREFERTLKQAS